ncbi:MAG: hypothetical protein ABJH98_04290 [Reichenbachiella sp.]|uniref:hypothetical protein n=1 Tax=Reichenbachiella sp. TaxID=2184521 RepID=UPI0032993113
MKFFLISLLTSFSVYYANCQTNSAKRISPLTDTEFEREFQFETQKGKLHFNHDGTFNITNEEGTQKGKISLDQYFEIHKLYFYHQNANLFLFLELTDGIDSYVQVNCVSLKDLSTTWTHVSAGLNLTESVIEDSKAYLAHINFVGCLDLNTGTTLWSLENLYNSFKITYFKQIELTESSVKFKYGTKSLDFNKISGERLN